jgi:hypothetical protein
VVGDSNSPPSSRASVRLYLPPLPHSSFRSRQAKLSRQQPVGLKARWIPGSPSSASSSSPPPSCTAPDLTVSSWLLRLSFLASRVASRLMLKSEHPIAISRSEAVHRLYNSMDPMHPGAILFSIPFLCFFACSRCLGCCTSLFWRWYCLPMLILQCASGSIAILVQLASVLGCVQDLIDIQRCRCVASNNFI